MTAPEQEDPSLQAQLRMLASQASPVTERADVMARALYALQFADQWLAEQMEEAPLGMRGTRSLRSQFSSAGHSVEITVEKGIERRVTGAIEPPAEGWALIRSGTQRELIRIDEDGMFSALVVSESPIDVALEFDDGVTITMKGIGDQAP